MLADWPSMELNILTADLVAAHVVHVHYETFAVRLEWLQYSPLIIASHHSLLLNMS